MPARTMTDSIAYLVTTKPGGVDGRDTNEESGKVVLATFDKRQAEQKANDGRYEIKREIVDNESLRAAYAKLTPLDLLLIETDMKTLVTHYRGG